MSEPTWSGATLHGGRTHISYSSGVKDAHTQQSIVGEAHAECMSDLTLTEDVDEGINPTRQRPLCARCEKIDYKRNGERAAKHLPGDVLPVEAIRFVVDFIEEGALVLEDGRLQLNPRITSLRHRQIKSGNGA